MEVIPSFQIDHTDLKPGIYISRRDTVGGETLTTYDIRMIHVNHEPAISPAAMHTIEHLAATWFRNHEWWKKDIIYWGPMGCLTGSYLIVKGNHDMGYVRDSIIGMLMYIIDYDGEIPGNKPEECGNYLLHNLPEAKYACQKYLDWLIDDFHSEYPEINPELEELLNDFKNGQEYIEVDINDL